LLGRKYYYKDTAPDGPRTKRPNAGEAATWIRMAADRGVPNAQLLLSQMYETGEGVPQDAALSLEWLRKAADQGLASARFQLGGAYFRGSAVLPQDYQLAMEWGRRAADQGDPNADRLIAQMYSSGLGVPRDNVQAQYWYTKAGQDTMATIGANGRACPVTPRGCGVISLVPLCLELQRMKAVLTEK
jgi:TPR repeat protein